jgi:AbrB family looped-hinge helix DNA binding protein
MVRGIVHGMPPTTSVTIDKAGRLVLPKAVREEAGIEPGMRLRVAVRDGRVEIEPDYAKVRVVESHGMKVLDLAEPRPPLPESAVRAISHKLRSRRSR